METFSICFTSNQSALRCLHIRQIQNVLWGNYKKSTVRAKKSKRESETQIYIKTQNWNFQLHNCIFTWEVIKEIYCVKKISVFTLVLLLNSGAAIMLIKLLLHARYILKDLVTVESGILIESRSN